MGVGDGSPISVPGGVNVLQNFSDATAGRSLQLYYGVSTEDSTGTDNILTRDSGISSFNKAWTNGGNSIDRDFDITINKPTIFAGIASIDVNWGILQSGSSNGATVVIEFNIIHYDGSTETNIGTITSVTMNETTTSSRSDKLKLLVTRQLFGVGHILRFNVIVTMTGDPTKYGGCYHDPQTAGQELKLWMPIVNLE